MNINDKARKMARDICLAFKLHDEKKYKETAQLFGEIYVNLYDDVDRETAMRAGFHEVESLRKHDLIEDAPDATAQKILDHDDWSAVYEEFKNVAHKLGIEEGFAINMVEFYRYHTAGKNEHFVEHALEAQRINALRLLGNGHTKMARVLAALFYVGVESHDVHSDRAWEIAENAMYIYYKTVLELRQANQ